MDTLRNLVGKVRFWLMAIRWRKKVNAHLSQGIKVAHLGGGRMHYYIPSESELESRPEYRFILPGTDGCNDWDEIAAKRRENAS